MNKILLSFRLIFLILIVFFTINFKSYGGVLYGLDKDCGTGELVVYIISNDQSYPSTTNWSPCGFTISWLVTEGAGLVGNPGSLNTFDFNPQNSGTDGTYNYQVYTHIGTGQIALPISTALEVARIPLTSSVNFVDFTIPASTNAWVLANSGLSFINNQNGAQLALPYAAVTKTDVPMYTGVFWDGTSWCGGTGTGKQPGPGDISKTCYINGMGAQLTTPYTNPANVANLTIAANSQLTIMPGAAMTLPVSGITTINSAQGLVIASDPTGSGSFKNSYTVANTVYGTGASATVQTYLKNTQSVGSFQIHLIGPTVFDQTIFDPPGNGPGCVRLSAYDMPGNTYAYRYREVLGQWKNIFNPTDSIPRMGGIALSDGSGGGSRTIALSGKLNTGTVLAPAQPPTWAPTITGTNGLYLFSNPYPCYMDLTKFYTDNNLSTRLGNNWFFWTWEHENGTWGTWFYDAENEVWDGTGHIFEANGIINPGQGFFARLNQVGSSAVRATSSAASDAERVHGYSPFLKSEILYSLRLKAAGNYTNEELIIKFRNNATEGFDEYKDIEKWFSMYEEATQIYTVASDQTMLIVNALPMLEPGQMVNVPMSFICSADDTYTITASNIESFENGTEIWLEDLKTGGEWYSLNANPVYEFSAAPGDVQERFIVHFFGPTGIDDPQAEINNIQIYGYGQDAYIVNRGNETIKEYVAYDLMGRELHRGTLPNSTVNKVTIGNVSAYYIVKVITKEGHVYTDKVYITK
jgi:hypothetical protein